MADVKNETEYFDHAAKNLKLRRLESYRVNAGPKWPDDGCSQEEIEKQLRALDGKLLFPGNLICAANGDIMDGIGTRLKCGWVISKVMGRVKYYRAEKEYKSKFPPFSMYTSTNTIVEVHPLRRNISILPIEGEKVVAYVTYVCQRFVKCRITHNYQGIPFQRPYFVGIIKADDAGGDLKADLLEKFHPGDSLVAIFKNERSHGGFNLRTNSADLGIISSEAIQQACKVQQNDNKISESTINDYLKILKKSATQNSDNNNSTNGHQTKKIKRN